MVSAKSGTMVSGDSFIYCRVKWPIFSGFNFKMQISSIPFFPWKERQHKHIPYMEDTFSKNLQLCTILNLEKKNVGSAYFIWCAMFYSIPFIVYNSDYFIIINTGNVHVFYKICHFISSINRVSITFFAPFLPMMRNSI